MMRYIAFFLVVFSLYLCTLHPTVAPYRDSGDLITAAATVGIAHPPGYPLYSLVGKLGLLLFPVGNPGYIMNVLSALAGAGAVTLFAYVVCGVVGSPLAAFTAAGVLAASPAMWRLSQVSEMYALNALFGILLMLVVWRLAMHTDADDVSNSLLCTAGFITGIACGNHQTIILVVPALVWFAWRNNLITVRTVGAALVCTAIGLSVYLYLPVRAATMPMVDWGHPATLNNLWRVITRADYGGMRLHPEQSTMHWTAQTIFAHLWVFVKVLADQFTLVGLVLGVWGWWVRRADRFFTFALLALLLSGPAFIILSNLPPKEATTLPILEPHMVLPCLFFAVFIASGIRAIITRGTRIAIAGVLLVASCGLHLAQCSYRTNFQAWDYGRNVRVTMQPNSILYNPDDSSAFITAYATTVCGKRPDIVVAAYYRTRWGYQELLRRHPDMLPARPIDSGEELSRVLLVYNQPRRAIYADLPAKFPSTMLSYPRGMLTRLSADNEYLPTSDPFIFYAMRGPVRVGTTGSDFFSDHIASYYSAAYSNLGLAYSSVHRTIEAERYLMYALAVEPTLSAALNNLGTLAFSSGDFVHALKWFDVVLRREPNSVSAHYNRGCALKAQGKLDEAVVEYTWAWENHMHPDSGNELGLIALQTDPLRAAAIFQAVIQKDPQYLNGYYNLGLALEKGGDVKQARKAYEVYAQYAPNAVDRAEVKRRINRLPK